MAENEHFPDLAGPASRGAAVTPSDATEFSPATRGLWVGGAGDVVITGMNGSDYTLSAVPAGTLVPVRATKVKAATTATLIIALW